MPINIAIQSKINQITLIFLVQNVVFFKKLLTNRGQYSIIMQYTVIVVQSKIGGFIMFESFKSFLVEDLRVNPDDITMEAELAGDLGINSLELADLVYSCEEKFDITIDDEDLHKFRTVGDVVKYLEEAKG